MGFLVGRVAQSVAGVGVNAALFAAQPNAALAQTGREWASSAAGTEMALGLAESLASAEFPRETRPAYCLPIYQIDPRRDGTTVGIDRISDRTAARDTTNTRQVCASKRKTNAGNV